MMPSLPSLISALPLWKKLCLAAAGLALGGGLGLKAWGALSGGSAPPATARAEAASPAAPREEKAPPPPPRAPAPDAPVAEPPQEPAREPAREPAPPRATPPRGAGYAYEPQGFLPPNPSPPPAERAGNHPGAPAPAAGASPAATPFVPPPAALPAERFAAAPPAPRDGSAPAAVPPAAPRPASPGLVSLSPPLVKGGLSFFLCFALGLALRSLARLAAIAVGLLVLTHLALAHAGWIEIHWELIERQLEGLAASLRGELGSLDGLVQGALPATGMGLLGVVTGWKRN